MGKINIAIIDNSRRYAESLAGYITLNYSLTFSVNSFSSIDTFISEHENKPERFHIILISPMLYSQEKLKSLSSTIILLEDDASYTKKRIPSVFKYRHCDSIVGDILDIFNSKEGRREMLHGNIRDTRVVGVYSPIGGAGKTLISTGLSIQCARRGMKAFYLNLESTSSLSACFDKREGHTLSKVLFSLKCHGMESEKTIKGAQVSDIYGIHYYTPPESPLELDELSVNGYGSLVHSLKFTGLYDTVVIDMESSLNRRNLAILQKCDVIIMPVTRSAIAAEKLRILFREIERMDRMKDTDLEMRIVAVENRYVEGREGYGIEDVLPAKSLRARLPYCREMEMIKDSEIFLNGKNGFVEGLGEILNRFVTGSECSWFRLPGKADPK